MTMINVSSVASGRFIRLAATAGLVGALLQVAGGVLETIDRVRAGEPGFAFRTALIGVAYLLLTIVVIGLGRSGLAGTGLVARLGLVLAGAGWVLAAIALFVLPTDVDLAEKVLFPVAIVLIGLGMIVAGVVTLRARRLGSWQRWTPLICGLYPFAVIFPVFAATGAPNFLVLSGWGLCWLTLSAALYQQK